MEKHIKPSVRVLDDFLEGGQNEVCVRSQAHCECSENLWMQLDDVLQ